MSDFHLFELDGTLTARGLALALEQQRRERAEREANPPPPIVPADLVPYLKLPASAEPRTLVRARMAREIERAMSAQGCVTRDDLERAGFTPAEISEHFAAAARIAKAERMVT